MNCPQCGKFMEQVRKESLAKLDGQRVWFTRWGDRCVCGYRKFDGLSRRAAFALEEDARLFEVAPELLKACEAFLAALDAVQGMGLLMPEGLKQSKYVKGLADAVAKVRGGER